MSRRKKYKDYHIEFLKDNIKGTSHKELTTLFNKEFGMDISCGSVRTLCSKNRLSNGRTTTFEKGGSPHNKELIGTVIDRQGAKVIKVTDTGDRKDWKTMHEFMWEFFYGKLKEDEVVVFKDGNKDNLSINNLMKVSRQAANSFYISKLKSESPEINEIVLNLMEIDRLSK